ncbi:MAG: tetratricopeptide (TPR) repeat protein [Verrucomicrobiales bacterium]
MEGAFPDSLAVSFIMKRKRSLSLLPSIGALALVGGLCSSSFAGPADDLVEDFASAYGKKESIPADIRSNTLERLRSKPTAQAVSNALRRFYPELDKAILEAEPEKSIQSLIKLTETGDPFLSAEAHYAIGRRLFADMKHEEALPLFQRVANELAAHSLRAGEATYYFGVCQEKMLLKKEALGTFETMVAFFGDDVSKRLRDDAINRIAQLQQDVDGSLGDVANHMGFSERKLVLTDTGERTVEVQDHIVAMLDSLIEQAENGPP